MLEDSLKHIPLKHETTSVTSQHTQSDPLSRPYGLPRRASIWWVNCFNQPPPAALDYGTHSDFTTESEERGIPADDNALTRNHRRE